MRGLAALPCALLLAREAGAAAYDPELTWRTLVTPHFAITFHGGEEALAEEMARAAERVWAEMSTEMGTDPPRRTELVLVDDTDSANGYAFTVPVNTIVVFVTAPQEDGTLSLYEDWGDAILTHEYAHILHLDTIEGLPRLLRLALGRVVSVNHLSPGWVVEGQATLQETRHTNAGRGRSAYVDMVKRMAVLEDAFPPLGNLDGYQADPPGGNLRYLFGQDFQQYVADRTGRWAWRDFFHGYGGSVPYVLPGRWAFGKGIPALYREWRAENTARYQRQAEAIRAEGLTEFEVISRPGDLCAGGRYSPDGESIAWSCLSLTEGSAIWLAKGDGTEAEVELDDRFASDVSWRSDSGAFAFSATHVVKRYNLTSDVYFHTLGGGTDLLTRGQRARNPDFSADGRELVVVTNEAQENQLARLTVDKRLDPITETAGHTQYSTPRYSPDGRFLAVSIWADGVRDLWVLSADGEPWRRVTWDAAIDVDPEWSADGRTLYFASDRTGVPNVYAIDLATEHLWQVTNVLGGAFGPSVSPDEAWMVFESYSADGTDIARMALDRARWKDRGALPLPLEHRGSLGAVVPEALPPLPPRPEGARGKRPRRKPERVDPALLDPAPVPGIDGLGGPWYALRGLPGLFSRPDLGDQPDAGTTVEDPTGTDVAVPEEKDYPFSWPVQRYNPLPTLFPPRFVSPSLYQTSYGFMGVLATAGVDTLRQYAWGGYVSYRTDSEYLGWGVSAVVNRWTPVISGGAYTYTVPYGDVYRYKGPPPEGGAWIPSVESTNRRYWDERLRAYTMVSWPLDSYRTVFAAWNGQLRQPMDPLHPSDWRPFLPTRGFLSSIGGGWRFARGQSFAKSISPEEARVVSVVADLTHPWLGSTVLDDEDQPRPFTRLQFTGDWREYRSLPWLSNHVLASKLAVGASAGDSQAYGSFRLGGSYGESAYYTLPDEWRALRGFPPATVYGDWYYLGSMEYRMPLARIDRGVGVLPFFARTLALAAFADAGNAFQDWEEGANPLPDTLVGAGAELQASMVLAWSAGVTVRTGYAFAVAGEGGYALGDPEGLYAWLGGTF